MTKFYEFCQNPTGGAYIIDDKLGHFVLIEAEDWDEANLRAEGQGVYFDDLKFESHNDCSCCGNRWTRVNKNSVALSHPEIDKTQLTWIMSSGPIVVHAYWINGRHEKYSIVR